MGNLEGFIIKDKLNLELNIVEKDGMLGVANKHGDLVLQCEYDEISSFNANGFASIKQKFDWKSHFSGRFEKATETFSYGTSIFAQVCLIIELISLCKFISLSFLQALLKE